MLWTKCLITYIIDYRIDFYNQCLYIYILHTAFLYTFLHLALLLLLKKKLNVIKHFYHSFKELHVNSSKYKKKKLNECIIHDFDI